MKYTLVIQEAEEGGYIGFVPEIPGANTQGETEEEVRENIREAVRMVLSARAESGLEELQKSGRPAKVESLEL
jgi:predicted RNase H-like HicB family nuclease